MDFYKIRTKRTKEGHYVYPDFIVQNSQDLLIKGGSFYAIWDEERGLWSRDEMDVAKRVDNALYAKADEYDAIPLLMSSFESSSWRNWKNYTNSLDDSEVDLDVSLSFADDPPDRKKYASRRLPYSLVDAPCPAWDELVGTLYLPSEREKIEWMIGSIVSGDSKKNQKFFVFYGQSGYGKSTILGVMEQLFQGYYIPIDMKALGQSGNSFAMAGFKNNPLLAIQHDGDLSKIEDNTKLNSLVSHELMPINEKFKTEYYTRIIALMALGTNEPVKITGSKSGIIRRLIDITPSGSLIENRHYHVLLNQIDFELGQIANHCLGVYYSLGKNYYSSYKPTTMMYETDIFYNFIENHYDFFYEEDGVTLERAWQMYKDFCEDSKVRHILQRHQFRSEMQNYFENFEDRADVGGVRVRSYYSGFKTHRFLKTDDTKPIAMSLDEKISNLDEILADMPAQYAKADGTPALYWDDSVRDIHGKQKRPEPEQIVSTTLKDLDTSLLHYVKVPENHIVIDFDLKDEHGNKSRERNLEAAAEWPATYAEYSQGGAGIHLHYYYDGPGTVKELRADYSEGIEVKALIGNSSLRRRFSQCSNVPIKTLTSGLPLKEKPMHDAKAMTSEKSVRKLIIENLHKDHMPGTKPSIDFIKKILTDAYESGIAYDVSDLYADVYSFALSSTHHARYCIDLVKEMPFQSENMELETQASNDQLVFYDVEVFPNLLVICWKFAGEGNTVVRMINPSPQEVENLLSFRLVGFNCRRYDNHIIYARAMGESIEMLYERSQRIISNDRTAYFGAAYDVSYTDIYDFSAKKQSLKKFEIELGIHHMELGLPWDQPVPEEKWELVTEYCANDVVATEATFEARKADFVAREILAELSGLSVNHSTQQHTARIVFGSEKKPQKHFLYTDLSKMFPGYIYDFGTSTYRDETVGEGGYVYAEPGVYKNVVLLDVASMHPTSIELLNLFGPYTERFSELKNARIAIKNDDLASARRMLDGKLAPYLENEDLAEALSYALKIVINIVYGLTSAKFENMFRDPRNKDNIVAKRGALFMIDLKHAVQEQGFQVAHIKTDSIKIPEATPEIIQFVQEFGAKYGYDFDHEATYDEFVLFNDAVYIAKNSIEAIEKAAAKGKTKPLWEATGAQFIHPYVFKTVLSGEEITFDDLCETRNVAKGEIYIDVPGENDSGFRRFVGRIGRFVPMLPGTGGGALLRVADVEVVDKDENGDKIPGSEHMEKREYAVTGTKGFEWLEAETVQKLGLEDSIDYSYFEGLVAKAREAMSALGYI